LTLTNPVLDQERAQFLRARASKGKALLSAWPRADKELPVVELEVDWVRFSTLNHRTKAEQLREVHNSKTPDLFTADPLGRAAQEAQGKILRGQMGFEELKADLKERGQQEHAVVSAEGVLINGNRRTAALRSLYRDDNFLGARYVRCLLLPEDATADELVDLEAELQIARDFKQAYSWVNEALLIEELYEREGRNFALVARKMHREKESVQSLYEKLQQLHQLVALSRGTKLHVDFTENESAFDELARYIKNKSKPEQDSVRSTYFLGTLSGVNYRTLRHLRRPDAANLVLAEMGSNKALKPLLATVAAESKPSSGSDALDELLGDDQGTETKGGPDLMEVLGYIACRGLDQRVTLDGGGKVLVKDLQGTIHSAIEAAAREAEESARDATAVTAPMDRLEEAISKLERVVETLARARALPEWKEDNFQALLGTLKELLPKLDPPSK
jgi:hypothetical protein